MRIGELAARAGVPAKTIRYYEDVGVLPPAEREPNGYREYDEASIEQLRFVRDAQAAGLSLSEIASVLELRRRGEGTCHHVLEMLEHHLADVDRQLRSLKSMRSKLEALTDRARRLDPADCTDPNRCQTIADVGATERLST